MNRRLPLNRIFIFSFFAFLLLFSNVHAQKTPSTKNNKQKKTNSFFVGGESATSEKSYSHIVGNTARLRAMLTGKFVQYSNNSAGDTTEYKVWKVNDGKDSIMIYQLPVGNFQKIGYWMFQYQIMTSLPDEPLYVGFTKLVEINRDTIQEIYYDAPSDFSVTLEDLLANPEKIFSQININQLKSSPSSEHVYYIRQSPLYFIGRSSHRPLPQNKDLSSVVEYHVKPQRIEMSLITYNKNGKEIERDHEHLKKLEMMKSDAPK